MTSPPINGYSYPDPRTWEPGDMVTTPRLRGDLTNMTWLYGGARPILQGLNNTGIGVSGGSATLMWVTNTPVNTWNVPFTNPISAPSPVTQYPVPQSGWWLAHGMSQHDTTLVISANDARYATGIRTAPNGGSVVSIDGESLPAPSSTLLYDWPAPKGSDLFQLNTETDDYLSWYAFFSNASGTDNLAGVLVTAEWVALPTSGLTNYTGPYGSVVASPPAPSVPPPGPGGTLMASTVAGAGTIVCSTVAGMVTGGAIGLEFHNGRYMQPTAEVGTISSLPGSGTVVLSGTLAYPHTAGAPIAIPLSAAWLNQQSDIIRFLAYPPILRAVATTTQSIANSTIGSPVQITNLSASASGCVDNFGGFASNGYVVPVAGHYYVYGQSYLAGSSSAFPFGAGVQVNSGTISWGTLARANTGSAEAMCAAFEGLLDVPAGGTISLWTFQGSGSSMSTENGTSQLCRLIVVWRSSS